MLALPASAAAALGLRLLALANDDRECEDPALILKKRAILYFFILGFPMGLGAGATSWLQLPETALFSTAALFAPLEGEAAPAEAALPEAEGFSAANWEAENGWTLDFGALHPLTVAAFSLLFCTGVLLAADGSSPTTATPPKQGRK